MKDMNIPLKQVSFSILWHLTKEEDLEASNFLLGEFYNKVQNDFPQREKVNVSFFPFANQPFPNQYKFYNENSIYSLIYCPNSFGIYTNDNNHSWEGSLFPMIEKYIPILADKVNRSINPDHYHAHLEYQNFIKYENGLTGIDFINEKLNLSIKQTIDNESDVSIDNFSLNFTTPQGKVNLLIREGVENDEKGIKLELLMLSKLLRPATTESIITWAEISHKVLISMFTKLFINKK